MAKQTKRQKELSGILRDSAEMSNNSMPIHVLVFDAAEKAWAEAWMKGKRGFKKIKVKVGDAVSEHVSLDFLD